MKKNDLREKWSKYCNTDKLVDETMQLLSHYGHENSEHGVCSLLDAYFTEKEPLIQLFVTSKNYIGDMRIATRREFDRQIDPQEVYSCVAKFCNAFDFKKLLKFSDNEGKTMFDHLLTGRTAYTLSNLPTEKERNEKAKKVSQFDHSNGATIESSHRINEFYDYMNAFEYINYSKLQNDLQCGSSKNAPLLKAGTKTSRAFNRVCHYYGVDKLDPKTVVTEENGVMVEKVVYPYNQYFAAYADLVSELVRKMYFIISLNPLDYLTMSVGVNWRSCHHIDGGGWKGGCLSYMLDGTSMITYVVEDLCEPIHENAKLYRQMFHYDNNLFVQNRLYPQGNDGATNLYDKFRGYVIDEFTDILNEKSGWTAHSGAKECSNHISSKGTHYKDYTGNNSCSIFYPKQSENKILSHVMTIGHGGICVKCGKSFTDSSRLSHRRNDRECVMPNTSSTTSTTIFIDDDPWFI